jgi:hypothetical protein
LLGPFSPLPDESPQECYRRATASDAQSLQFYI